MVQRLRLIGAFGEPVWVSPRQSESYWEEDDNAAQLARVRAVTGATLDSPESVAPFLEDVVAALLLMQDRANGATEIDMPRMSAHAPTDPGITHPEAQEQF